MTAASDAGKRFGLLAGKFPALSQEICRRRLFPTGYILLPLSVEHAAGVETLPPHHADPFDRLRVAQALAEPLRLVTHDAKRRL